MQSQIILCEDLPARQERILKHLTDLNLALAHPDVLLIADDSKLGIAQAREIHSFLSLKPYSAKGRVIVVESAHNLTSDAQNALLKTLEEPPPHAAIFLGAAHLNAFLPTVLSRCEVVSIPKPSQTSENLVDIEKFLSQDLTQQFATIEKVADKKVFLHQLISYFQKVLHQNPKEYKKLEILLEAEEWSKQNVNPRAVLEYLVLSLKNF